MKDHRFIAAILSIALFFMGGEAGKAATLYLDLDRDTPGIQSTGTLTPGSTFEFEVLFSADGATQFDTFAFDVVHTASHVTLDSPLAGPIVESAPLMALDLYGANVLSSGDTLTRGSQPTPLGFEGGLGGVGVSSVGGMPFPLLGQDETVGLFSASLTALNVGTSTLALSGFPFGVGAELNLGGERVPVTLQGATVTVVPLPPTVWLFATGMLALLGVGRRSGAPIDAAKRILSRWLFLALALISPISFAALDTNADINGDAMVTSQDISKLAGCFGQNPLSNSDCTRADVDEDGDIDVDDFRFVSERLGEAYPWMLYSAPMLFDTGSNPVSVVVGDINGDALLDTVVANQDSNDVSVLLGNGDGSFQEQQRFVVGDSPSSVALGDIDGDGMPDVVVANEGGDDISVLLGNGDGRFQAQQRFDVGGNPRSVGLGDFNGDSVIDVVVANGGSDDISVLLGNGDGSFQAQQRYVVGDSPSSVGLGDLNRDGTLDMVVANEGDDDISVLLGNGDGSFQTQQRNYVGGVPSSVALGDINGDGALDVVVADTGSITVLLGNGNGTFQMSTHHEGGQWPISVALGDINGDGALDAVTAGVPSSIIGYGDTESYSVIIGNGDGSFQPPQTNNVSCREMTVVALGDVNGDSLIDVVTNCGDSILILPGNSDGGFQGSQIISSGEFLYLSNLVDLNGDGILDIVEYGGVYDTSIRVILGTGDGNFQGSWSYGISGFHVGISGGSPADLNGDGILDMVVTTGDQDGGHEVLVFLGNGDGSFQEEPVGTPKFFGSNDRYKMVVVDVNGDGAQDLVAVDRFIMLGNGDGTLQEPQNIATLSTISSNTYGDVNGDGVVDIVGFGDDGDILVLRGNGDCSFEEQLRIDTGNSYSEAILQDINGDGALDLVGLGADILVLFGNGDGGFKEQHHSAISLYSATLGDVNGDGTVDMVGLKSGGVLVLLGNGDGSFQVSQRFAASHPIREIKLGDLNGDGKLDVVLNGITEPWLIGHISVLF